MDKPVIILGNGIRDNKKGIDALRKLGHPILTTWMAADLLDETDPSFCGRPGVIGQRAANIIVQKATHLYVFGARLDGPTVAFDLENFAPNAVKLIFDIDPAERNKFPHHWNVFEADLDLAEYKLPVATSDKWLKWCKNLYNEWRCELDNTNFGEKYIDPKAFMWWLSGVATKDDFIAVGSSGIIAECFMQSFQVKLGQKIRNISTFGAMGADIPMAVGAALSEKKRVICITGDGSFMMNPQALYLASVLNLQLKVFVWNNTGYGSVKNMQRTRMQRRYYGIDRKTGLYMPHILNICDAMFVPHSYISLSTGNRLLTKVNMETPGPHVFEMAGDPDYTLFPRVTATDKLVSYKLENMTPELTESVLAGIMAEEP